MRDCARGTWVARVAPLELPALAPRASDNAVAATVEEARKRHVRQTAVLGRVFDAQPIGQPPSKRRAMADPVLTAHPGELRRILEQEEPPLPSEEFVAPQGNALWHTRLAAVVACKSLQQLLDITAALKDADALPQPEQLPSIPDPYAELPTLVTASLGQP
jgi:hypothetical protein